jgi:hypothetical protein
MSIQTWALGHFVFEPRPILKEKNLVSAVAVPAMLKGEVAQYAVQLTVLLCKYNRCSVVDEYTFTEMADMRIICGHEVEAHCL